MSGCIRYMHSCVTASSNPNPNPNPNQLRNGLFVARLLGRALVLPEVLGLGLGLGLGLARAAQGVRVRVKG